MRKANQTDNFNYKLSYMLYLELETKFAQVNE